MTAVKGKTPPAKTGDEAMGGGFMSFSGFQFTVPAGTANTPEAMRRAVDEQLKRPENMGICKCLRQQRQHRRVSPESGAWHGPSRGGRNRPGRRL